MSVFVLSNEWSGSWEKALTKKPKSADSVIFDVDHADMILEDAKKFLNNGAWYANMGIPYRRGYLLYGPPGTKLSFIEISRKVFTKYKYVSRLWQDILCASACQ